MENPEPSKVVVDKMTPELKALLQDKLSKLPQIKLQDGKAMCPGCNQEVHLLNLGPKAEWMQVQGTCPTCRLDFVVVKPT